MRQRACKPGSVLRRSFTRRRMCGHSSRPRFASGLKQPTRAASRNQARVPPLFGLAPGGVYRAGPVARTAVRSCRTLSTLPVRRRGGVLSVALSLTPAFAGPPGVTRHRGSMEPGLSSPETNSAAAARPSGGACAPSHSGGRAGYCGRGSNKESSLARHSPSMTPSMRSGRKRRWKAITALSASVTS